MGRIVLATVCLVMGADPATSAYAQQRAPPQAGDTKPHDKINDALYSCLQIKCLQIKSGQSVYTSFDGGKSAIFLLGQCSEKAFAFVDHCVADDHIPRSECQLQTGILAQTALKRREAGIKIK
jgi:hypothetical protein